MSTVDVLNSKGQKAGSVELADAVFKVKAPSTLIHEVVTAYLANQRRGTHSTKTRGEVSGGGLKPWKQKHTGNARAGSIRSPLWRHGGITFVPKPRSYVQAVPPAKRRLALRAVLSSFVADGKLAVVDQFLLAEPKTKLVAAWAAALKLGPKTVVVVDDITPALDRATRNFAGLRLCRARDLTSYAALLADQLVFTKVALDQITARLDGSTPGVN